MLKMNMRTELSEKYLLKSDFMNLASGVHTHFSRTTVF